MMNRIILSFAATLLLSIPVNSQVTKPKAVTKPATKLAGKPVVAAKPVMKTLLDSASYAIGIFTVNSFQQYGIDKMNSALVARAIEDMLGNKKLLLSDSLANASITK